MAIQNLLSLSFLVPYVASKLDFSRAIRGLRGMPRRLLLVGHKGGTGHGVLNVIAAVTTEAEAISVLGEGSMLLAMWRAAKANTDLGLPIDVLPVPTGVGAVAATSTVSLTNSAGAGAVLANSGEAILYIGGVRVAVGATQADTQATVTARLLAAINANPKLPVIASATANTNEILLTCKWAGPSGNDIDLRTTFYVDDRIPVGLTINTPAFANGAVAPDLSGAVAAMNGYRATEIACAFTDGASMNLFEGELATRWLANNMQDGALCVAVRGTEAQLTTWLATRNSPHVHAVTTTKDATSPWETAAMAAAAIESQAAVDPAVPATGIVLQGYKGPAQGQHWTIDQLNNLLVAGGMPLAIAQDATGSLLRAVTTYTQTPATGAADRSMAELCWIKTASYKRWFNTTEFLTKYQGYKLAQYITDPIPGQKIMTAQLGEEIMLGIYKLFMDAGLCQNMDYYRSSLVVEVDGPNGRLKIQDEPVLVTQHYQTEITSYIVGGQV